MQAFMQMRLLPELKIIVRIFNGYFTNVAKAPFKWLLQNQ